MTVILSLDHRSFPGVTEGGEGTSLTLKKPLFYEGFNQQRRKISQSSSLEIIWKKSWGMQGIELRPPRFPCYLCYLSRKTEDFQIHWKVCAFPTMCTHVCRDRKYDTWKYSSKEYRRKQNENSNKEDRYM